MVILFSGNEFGFVVYLFMNEGVGIIIFNFLGCDGSFVGGLGDEGWVDGFVLVVIDVGVIVIIDLDVFSIYQ